MRIEGGPTLAAGRSRAWIQAGLFAAPLVVLVGLSWAHRNIIDDGFIYLRVVRQVTSGHGPVFNAGERVEAFTGPLWLAILTIADLLTPIRLEWIAVGIGIIFTTAGTALAMLGAARLARQHNADALLAPVGVVVLLALAPMWFYASSGLETGLVFLWLGACLWILAKWSESDVSRMTSVSLVVLGLGWLVRPELVVYSLVFVAMILALQWGRQRWRGRARLLVTALALPAVYQIFRMGYYGSLVANTAIAKEGTRVRWSRGWNYFLDFESPYRLWIPLLLLAVGVFLPLVLALRHARRRRALAVVGAFITAAVLNALYVIAIGGDYEHARLLLPSMFAVCAPVALVPLTRRYLAAVAIVPWAVVCAVNLRPPEYSQFFANGFVFPAQRSGRVTTNDFGWQVGGPNRKWYTGPALYVEKNGFVASYPRVNLPLLPSVHLPTLVIGGVGIESYAMGTNMYVLDTHGLADVFTGHLRAPATSGNPPGHEKPLPAPWWVARVFPPGTEPNPSLFGQPAYPLIPPTHGAAFTSQVAWARAALRCPPVERLIASADAPLTPRRFITNIVHSFSNTFLRIDPDPERAYHQMCGSGTPPEVNRAMGAGNARPVQVIRSEAARVTGVPSSSRARSGPSPGTASPVVATVDARSGFL